MKSDLAILGVSLLAGAIPFAWIKRAGRWGKLVAWAKSPRGETSLGKYLVAAGTQFGDLIASLTSNERPAPVNGLTAESIEAGLRSQVAVLMDIMGELDVELRSRDVQIGTLKDQVVRLAGLARVAIAEESTPRPEPAVRFEAPDVLPAGGSGREAPARSRGAPGVGQAFMPTVTRSRLIEEPDPPPVDGRAKFRSGPWLELGDPPPPLTGYATAISA